MSRAQTDLATGSFLPPGYSSSPKAVSCSLRNLTPNHKERGGSGGGEEATLFLANLNLLRILSPEGEKPSVPNTSHKSFAE